MLRIRFGEFDFDARLGELRKGARRLKVAGGERDRNDRQVKRRSNAGHLVRG